MKSIKLFLAAGLLLTAVCANAQLNIHAGYIGSRFHDGNAYVSPVRGARAGAAYEIALNAEGNFTLRPGVDYSYAVREKKRGKYFLTKISTTEQSLAVPVHVKYAFKLTDRFGVYAFAGPSALYGVAMKAKYTFKKDPNIESPFVPNYDGYLSRDIYTGKVTSDIDDDELIATYTNEGNTFSRFDIAVGAGAGIQYGRVFLEAGYDLGLLNRTKNSDKAWRHDQMNVTLGLTF